MLIEETVIRCGFGGRCAEAGTGSPLILGYQESGATRTGFCATVWVGLAFKDPFWRTEWHLSNRSL